MDISDEEFEELLRSSSLGTQGAQSLIERVPPDVARRLLDAVNESVTKRQAEEEQS